MLAAACGKSSKSGTATTTTAKGGGAGGKQGGELTDLGTFSASAPLHIDPALNSELDAYQVVNALYDGLTEIDYTDSANPKVVPLVAESVKPNADASEWVFKIKKGQKFSDGTAVLPSSFEKAWLRASDPALAGDYSYLFSFIKGGKERLAGTATTLAGVKADDATLTLTVTLAEPYSNFDAVSGFQIFFPMPDAVTKLTDQKQWENQVMIGNGPFKMEAARNDQKIVVVPNPNWAGDIFGNKKPKLDKITFVMGSDVEAAYNSFAAGEGDVANIPPGRAKEADTNYKTTLDVSILGSYHFDIDMNDPVVGGAKNKLLREAISMAINRDEINSAVYDGTRTTSTGVTPKGIPGFKAGLCKYCGYDEAKAQKAFNDWKAAGNSLTAPIKIQLNAGAGHEDVVAIMIDNLKKIGIQAAPDPLDSQTYFKQLRAGACQICRAGWYADYPTYDNFMFDLFHAPAGGNNLGPYLNPAFDAKVDEAKKTVDKAARDKLFQESEDILLNEDVGVIPINWYRGDYVYDPDKVASFPQTPLGIVNFELVALKG
jgi:oligopeptide transport system substrate-binding protein